VANGIAIGASTEIIAAPVALASAA